MVTLPYGDVTILFVLIIQDVLFDWNYAMTDTPATPTQSIKDHNRPSFHYLPPANWMNDPNGVIQWNDRYHLFYQYNPNAAYHADMHWGHAVSDDLIHWEVLPVAMAPTPGTADEGGIFSGCIVNHNGTPCMFYTGVNADNTIQTQCLATSDDDTLVRWHKHPANPVVATMPAALAQTADFRDPFVWRGDDAWYMVVGSRIAGIGGAVLLYRSQDMVEWEYLNPILVGENARNGVMWECPNLFQLGEKWVLIISSHIGHTTGTVLYFIGDYRDDRFIPETEGVLDPGYLYAPLTYLDNQNRRIMHAWLREGRPIPDQVAAGWSGVQSIPRILTLDSANRLVMQPVPELEQLRATHHHFAGTALDDLPLPVSGLALELRASFDVTAGTQCGLTMSFSEDEQERVDISYDAPTRTLRVYRQYASGADEADAGWQGIPHALDSGEKLDLHILLDGSVLEIIANERTSLTSRIYPQNAEYQHLRVSNPRVLDTLDVWEMATIWPLMEA